MSLNRIRAHLSVNGSLVDKDVIPAVGRGDETVCIGAEGMVSIMWRVRARSVSRCINDIR
jgi:hypothetical protein